MTDRKASVRRILDMPFIGFAPWILLSVVEGPGRVALAAALACALSIAIATTGAAVRLRPKMLDITGIGFFGAMLAIAVADSSTQRWLGLWAGEVSNAAVALITVVSITVRRPFTLAYARETTERDYWNSPLFLRINYAISSVWAIAFIATAIVGYIGDGPLHQPNNIWTNWIIQIALLIAAIKFTAWYPDHATAEPHPDAAPHTHKHTALEFARPLAAFLIPVGILVMIVTNNTWWIGAALIVIGIVASRRLRQSQTTLKNAAAPPPAQSRSQ